MKNYLLAVICSMCFYSCSKAPVQNAIVRINDQSYTTIQVDATHNKYDDSRINLNIIVMDENNMYRLLYFNRINVGSNEQHVYPQLQETHDSCSGYVLMSSSVDGVAGYLYAVNDSIGNNIINIESYKRNKLKGSFNMNALMQKTDPKTKSYPEPHDIHATGKFEVTVL